MLIILTLFPYCLSTSPIPHFAPHAQIDFSLWNLSHTCVTLITELSRPLSMNESIPNHIVFFFFLIPSFLLSFLYSELKTLLRANTVLRVAMGNSGDIQKEDLALALMELQVSLGILWEDKTEHRGSKHSWAFRMQADS